MIDDVAVNEAFRIGFDRTSDLIELIEDGHEGEAELVGIFIGVVYELARRWDVTPKKAMKHVARVL